VKALCGLSSGLGLEAALPPTWSLWDGATSSITLEMAWVDYVIRGLSDPDVDWKWPLPTNRSLLYKRSDDEVK
jgi:hypothetical protein